MQQLRTFNRQWAQRTDYHVGDAIRTRWLWRYLDPLMQRGDRDILDAGAGAGQHALRLAAAYPQARVFGLDNRPDAVAQAQRRAQAQGLANATFAVADLTEPLPGGPFDIVYSVDVIEHVAQDQQMLQRLADALRPGGHLLIHTPLTPQRHFLRRFDLDRAVNELHVREGYRRGELEAKAQTAGLRDIQSIPTHAAAGTLAWELWRLVRPWAPLKLLFRPLLMTLVRWETNRKPSHHWPPAPGPQPTSSGNCLLLLATKPSSSAS